MSRFSRALAAAAMAVAAAGGGLLIAAAGTVPASASARPAPHGGHAITITAHPRAHAASGIGPHDILPCAVKPGAKPASTCTGGNGDQTISCSITAYAPAVDTIYAMVIANLEVDCTSEVTSIRYTQNLLRNGVAATSHTNTVPGRSSVATSSVISCQSVSSYQNIGDAFITFPQGYILTAGSNPIHQQSAILQVPPFGCSGPVGDGGGGGGGGGCAIHAPSLAGHPAGRHPDLITCG